MALWFDRRAKVLVILSAILCVTVLVSNILATKIWDLMGIPVDGGLIIFPISYIVSDLLVELFGRKIANKVVLISVAINVAVVGFFIAAVYLPPYAGWDGQEAFSSILNFSVRITGASLLSFLLSNFVNSRVFEQVRKKQEKSGYRTRALLSSLAGRVVDVVVFEAVAFLGVLPFKDFVVQAVGAYVEGQFVELVILVCVADFIAVKIQKYIDSDPDIMFTPR